jgi:hypothetical protein
VCAIMSVLCLRICQVSAVGFLAAMMWLLCVIAVLSNIRTLDEMGKRIHLQAASIAFVATVILNYVFFGLETARICALKATDPLSKKRDEAIRTACRYCRQPLPYRIMEGLPVIREQSPVMSTNQTCGLCVYMRAAEGFRSPYAFMRACSRKDCRSLARRTSRISRRP